jgi:hypothetical protein
MKERRSLLKYYSKPQIGAGYRVGGQNQRLSRWPRSGAMREGRILCQKDRHVRSLILIAVCVIGLFCSVTTLVRTINSGAARLRGGRRVTATRQPYLFRANLVALWVAILVFVGMLYLGLAELLAI